MSGMNQGSTPKETVPQVSVITVSFNAMAVLPDTLASLRAQRGVDYEWVVVDGASKDGSAEWCAAQSPDAFVSEPDRGIYDAMNKAVRLARGEWVYFLNAGDRLADEKTLADLVAAARPQDGVVYGDVVYFGDHGERRKRFDWVTPGNLVYGDLCHQAAIARRRYFTEVGPFDLAYRWNADFDWLLKVVDTGAGLRYVPRDVAWFHDAGAHVANAQKSEAERDIVRAHHCSPRWRWLLGHGLLRARLKLRRIFGAA
jgi:glycosyltransferase involved in cell wall biosynthesis